MVRYLVQAVRQRLEAIKSNLPVRSLNIMMSIIESMHNNLAGWAGQNGQSSGTSGFGFQLEAIQICW